MGKLRPVSAAAKLIQLTPRLMDLHNNGANIDDIRLAFAQEVFASTLRRQDDEGLLISVPSRHVMRKALRKIGRMTNVA